MSNETPQTPHEPDEEPVEATEPQHHEDSTDPGTATVDDSADETSVREGVSATDREDSPEPEPEPEPESSSEPEPETVRIDEVPIDVGEPEPAVEAPGASDDAVSESEGTLDDAAAHDDEVVVLAYDEVAVEELPVAAAATAPTTPVAPAPAAPSPIYVTAPTPPKAKGNRLMGILIAVVATVAYAVVFAVVTLGIFALRDVRGSVSLWEDYLQTAGFWAPVVVFFLAYVLLIVIVNRGGWWAYGIGSFFVALIVYFGYLAGALITVSAWKLDSGQVAQFVGTLWSSPLTFASAVVALEASLWFGAWIAARGRRVRERNLEAQRDYDRRLQAGPTA